MKQKNCKGKKRKLYLENRGFAVSGILYPILILTLFLIVQILTMMSTRKAVLDKNKQQLLDSVNRSNKIYNNEELSILLGELQSKLDGVQNEQKNALNKAYPIGSVYLSYSNTNPGTLFGGTWTAYGAGRTLVGMDTSQTEFNTIGKTGGSKTHNHNGNTGSTVLSINQIPSHTHDVVNTLNNTQGIVGLNVSNAGDQNNWAFKDVNDGAGSTGSGRFIAKATGGGGGHTHTIASASSLMPYITVYMWRRTS